MEAKTIIREQMFAEIITERDIMILQQSQQLDQKDRDLRMLRDKLGEAEKKIKQLLEVKPDT